MEKDDVERIQRVLSSDENAFSTFFELNVIDWVKRYAQGIFLTQICLYACRTANAKTQREDGYFSLQN